MLQSFRAGILIDNPRVLFVAKHGRTIAEGGVDSAAFLFADVAGVGNRNDGGMLTCSPAKGSADP